MIKKTKSSGQGVIPYRR